MVVELCDPKHFSPSVQPYPVRYNAMPVGGRYYEMVDSAIFGKYSICGSITHHLIGSSIQIMCGATVLVYHREHQTMLVTTSISSYGNKHHTERPTLPLPIYRDSTNSSFNLLKNCSKSTFTERPMFAL